MDAMNPILTEIQGLSPAAKGALGMAGHTLPMPEATAAAGAPSVIPPGMLLPHPENASLPGNISMPGVTPMLPSSAPPSLVTGPKRGQSMMSDGEPAPIGTAMGDQAERSRLLSEGSGISQIGSKIENSRLGEAHPFAGKLLGGLAQGAATLGDIGLSAVAPQIAINTPGTEMHHQELVNRADKAVAQDTTNAQREAQAASENATAGKTNAETTEVAPNAASTRNLQSAEAEHAGAEAGAISKPQLEVHDTEEGPILVNRSTGTAQHVTVDGQPVGPKLTLKESQPVMGPDNQPHTYMLDDKGNKVVDLGVHDERPQNVNVNGGDAAVDRLATRLGKPYQTAYDKSSAQLDNVDKTLRSIASGYKGQALALPETLTSLVSGQGTGVRVTMPELQMVGQHNGVKGDVESFINKVSGEGSMTDEDKKQLSGILTEMRGILQDKLAIHSGALDAINGANSREEIQQADKVARKQLIEYEKIGAMPDRAKHFATLPDGTRVMSEDENHWQNIVTGQEVK